MLGYVQQGVILSAGDRVMAAALVQTARSLGIYIGGN